MLDILYMSLGQISQAIYQGYTALRSRILWDVCVCECSVRTCVFSSVCRDMCLCVSVCVQPECLDSGWMSVQV